MLSDITWTADPAIFTIGSKEIRWYSLMFIIGFGIGYKIVERMWRRESINPKWIDPLLYYTLIGTVVGARLGHCLFYDPGYYLSHPKSLGRRFGQPRRSTRDYCRNLFLFQIRIATKHALDVR